MWGLPTAPSLEALVADEARPATKRQKLALMRTVELNLPEGITYANVTFEQAAELLDSVDFIPPSDAALLFAADYGITVPEGTSSWELCEMLDERGPKLEKSGTATYSQRKALLRAVGIEWPKGVDIMNVTFDQARKMLDDCLLLPPSDEQLVLAAELDLEVPAGVSSAGLTEILTMAIKLAHEDADAAKDQIIANNPAIRSDAMIVLDGLLYRIDRIFRRRGQWFAQLSTVKAVLHLLKDTERAYKSIKAMPLINLTPAQPTDVMTYTRERTGINH